MDITFKILIFVVFALSLAIPVAHGYRLLQGARLAEAELVMQEALHALSLAAIENPTEGQRAMQLDQIFRPSYTAGKYSAHWRKAIFHPVKTTEVLEQVRSALDCGDQRISDAVVHYLSGYVRALSAAHPNVASAMFVSNTLAKHGKKATGDIISGLKWLRARKAAGKAPQAVASVMPEFFAGSQA